MNLAYHLRHMLELWRLENFVSASEGVAEELFTKHIRPHVCRFLERFLRSYFVNHDEREEVIVVVLSKLWVNRTRIEIRSVGAWWRYVGRMAHRSALDQLGSSGREEETGYEWEEAFTDEFWDALDIGDLYRAADELWLGVPKAEPVSVRDQKLLAAKLFYVDGFTVSQIVSFGICDREVTIGELSEWLQESAVLDRVAHQTMHRSNDDLTSFALGFELPLTGSSLEDLASKAQRRLGDPPTGWSWEEVCVILYRYRNGLSETKIAQLFECSGGFVSQTLEKCRQNVPVKRACEKLQRTVRERGVQRNSMAETGVWKRTAFQYDIQNEYPQKLIVELMEPPCDLGPFKFNAGILNVWISGERLFKQLRDYIMKERKGE